MLKKDQDKVSEPFIVMDAPIYTIKEQILYPLRIPACDLFWSPHYNIPLLPIKAKRRAVTIHDVCHIATPYFFPKVKRLVASKLLRQAIKNSDLVVTVSEFSKQEIIKRLFAEPEKIHVVLNGVKKKEEAFTSLLSFGLKKPFFLYVGNIKLHKNLDRTINAFLSLNLDCDFVLAGKISCHLPEHPRVKVLGEVEEKDLSLLYSQAIALIQPSLYEGFGLTPLEAMDFGCPVIASSSASLPEVCGQAAYYVDPLSEESIAKGMQAVFFRKDLRETLIQSGFCRVKEFSWDKAASQLTHLFRKEIFFS